VASLLADAVVVGESLTRAKSIDLRVDADAVRGATLFCDHDRVLQVLSNLLDNAAKFSPEPGKIVLAARPEPGAIRFSVSDEGPGIGAAQLAHVFDRLWHGKSSAHQGLGLGLRIARGLVQAHQGRIWVESAPGKGSTFFFTLPLGDERDAKASSKRDSSGKPDASGP
jgi:signal transduction histidine kinase